MIRALAAAALAVLAAMPATAATINFRNCSTVAMAIELRSGSTPSGTVLASTTGLAHGGTWTGACGTSGVTCWVRIVPPLFGAENVQAQGSVCLIPRMSDGRYATFNMASCPC